MQYIQLTQGYVTIVDDEDYEWLNQWRWYYKGGYAVRNIPDLTKPSKQTTMRMHRAILGATNGVLVDHRDKDRLNNRFCNQAENLRNRGRNANNKTGFKGVSFDSEKGKFKAQIKSPQCKVHLGYYPTPELAHEAYIAAVQMYHGEFARVQ